MQKPGKERIRRRQKKSKFNEKKQRTIPLGYAYGPFEASGVAGYVDGPPPGGGVGAGGDVVPGAVGLLGVPGAGEVVLVVCATTRVMRPRRTARGEKERETVDIVGCVFMCVYVCFGWVEREVTLLLTKKDPKLKRQRN